MDYKKTIDLDLATTNFLNQLTFQGATYSSITVIKNSESIFYKSTNKNWDEIYYNSGASKFCHLISAASKLVKYNKDFTIVWDMITPNSEIAHHLNELRAKNNLCHGVSFIQKISNSLMLSINLTGRYGDLNFSTAVIENKKNIINKFLKISNLQKNIR